MKSEFEMIELQLLRHFSGIEVKQIENGIFFSKEKYVEDIFERFNMHKNKSVPTPTLTGLKLSEEYCSSNVSLTLYKSMVGDLIYLMIIRLDIIYDVVLELMFTETPKETHWQAAKMI